MAHAPVVLNVYNMYWLNEYTSSVGLGVYHSGLEVYGREFAFGGHPFDFTGIFETVPKDIADLGEEFVFKETIALGFTDFSEDDVNNMIEMLGKSYIGSSYHLIERNCNHFTNELSKLLTGKTIPNWINRLATICVRFPFIGACIPKEWLTPDGATFSNFDLTEWEEIESPDGSSKEASGDFPTTDSISATSRLSGSSEYQPHNKCFKKDDETDAGGGGGLDDLSETISITQMLDEINIKQHNRSPSNDSLISRLDVVNLVDVGDDKTNNKIDDEYEGG